MNFEMSQLLPVLPEIFVLGMACVILLVDPFLAEARRSVTYLLSLGTLVGAFLLTARLYGEAEQVVFSGFFVLDGMAVLLKLTAYVAVAAAFLYAPRYLREREMLRGEYFVLGLLGLLGMMILISAHNLLTVYLGLELMSLSLYAMVAMQRDSVLASEAAMKYFVLGAMASAMLLYGMSMLYGLTGTLDLAEIHTAIAGGSGQPVVLAFALVFIIIGVAFKLGAVPFHMWVPDVYHGAPTTVTVYMSAAPKLAAFAMLMRLLVDGLGGLHGQWQEILIIITLLSLAVGNVIAIAQTNIKRMLAYSAISHVAFMLLGVLAGTEAGYASGLFYAVSYALMSLASFGMVIFMSRAGFEADNLEDYKGLNERSPWHAFLMLMVMFSMAGVPPFLGFWSKLFVIQAAVQADLVWLAVAAVVFSVIGAFYYLRVVKLMYFDKPADSAPLEAGWGMRMTISANALAMLGLGILPGPLMALCIAATAG
ncbi:MAG: NADH-quinone oxidoreductase subunit NuoN [Gammaproteobacteria bacterium]|nr:NADH-quinone oxidoreductase subunit NuoN [Gammaproteobacteria bacterium]